MKQKVFDLKFWNVNSEGSYCGDIGNLNNYKWKSQAIATPLWQQVQFHHKKCIKLYPLFVYGKNSI